MKLPKTTYLTHDDYADFEVLEFDDKKHIVPINVHKYIILLRAENEELKNTNKDVSEWIEHIEEVNNDYKASHSALRAENDALRKLMQEAVDNCPTCRGEIDGSRLCARCQTFLKAIC